MGKLLEVYDAMTTQVAQTEVEKTAAQQEAEEVTARMKVLSKYAAVADELLEKEHGDKYTEKDVVKLATELIQKDAETAELADVVDYYTDAGTIMAQAFKAELAKVEEVKPAQ